MNGHDFTYITLSKHHYAELILQYMRNQPMSTVKCLRAKKSRIIVCLWQQPVFFTNSLRREHAAVNDTTT